MKLTGKLCTGTRIRTTIKGFGDLYSTVELCPFLIIKTLVKSKSQKFKPFDFLATDCKDRKIIQKSVFLFSVAEDFIVHTLWQYAHYCYHLVRPTEMSNIMPQSIFILFIK